METVVPTPGQVSLGDKQTPVCSRQEPYEESYAYLRGRVDHSELKALLQSLSPETWYAHRS